MIFNSWLWAFFQEILEKSYVERERLTP